MRIKAADILVTCYFVLSSCNTVTHNMQTNATDSEWFNSESDRFEQLSGFLSMPTNFPISVRSLKPSIELPTRVSSTLPTLTPTELPTQDQTRLPTLTEPPTKDPTGSPTLTPTESSSVLPTLTPTELPAQNPTTNLTRAPFKLSTKAPSELPSYNPTGLPTLAPTESPTKNPTGYPMLIPTKLPTLNPTEPPTDNPTKSPTLKPTPVCHNVRDFETKVNGVTLSCDLIGTKDLREKYCSFVLQFNGSLLQPIKQFCPDSCNFDCSPSPLPTLAPTTPTSTQFICVELQTQDTTAYVKKLKRIYRGVSGKNIRFGKNSSDRSNAFNFIRDERFCADPPRMIQRYISALFYFATKGDNWEESISWLSARHECEWRGITCNNKLVVTGIERDENSLAGTIPYEICDLPLLNTLDLDANKIGGTIPRRIGRCQNLQVFDIDTNLIIGSFPESIFDITGMIALDVDKNMKTGTLSNRFGNLEELKFLSIHSNQFKGRIPKSLGRLKNLGVAYLDNNNLTGLISNAICENVSSNGESTSNNLAELTADCRAPNPEVICDCCTACYKNLK